MVSRLTRQEMWVRTGQDRTGQGRAGAYPSAYTAQGGAVRSPVSVISPRAGLYCLTDTPGPLSEEVTNPPPQSHPAGSQPDPTPGRPTTGASCGVEGRT